MGLVSKLLQLVRGWIGRKPEAVRPRLATPARPETAQQLAAPALSVDAPPPIAPQPAPSEPAAEASAASAGRKDAPDRQRAAMLDGRHAASARLKAEEEALLADIERRIESGRFHLPQLPSTTSSIMGMVNDPRVEIAALTRLISSDPALSGQLVRMANSALYAGQEPVRTIQDGVMRIGMRALRTLVLSASMKGIMLTGKGVASYGKTVWRQALSVARIARTIAPRVGFDQETAFLLALLHDVGKLPLLAMLDEASRAGKPVSRALIGKVFQRFHEKVGGALAERWHLGAELIAVTGCHHEFEKNEGFQREAALVSLAHKLDLYKSLRDDRGFDALAGAPEMDALGVPTEARRQVLELATTAYETMEEEVEVEAA